MKPTSPTEALGPHAQLSRKLVVDSVRTVHDNFSLAHTTSRSKSTAGFGTQWRDQLESANSTFKQNGFGTYVLKPAGHEVPVVNGAIIYVWRTPVGRDSLAHFARRQTRRNALHAPPLSPSLFDNGFAGWIDDDIETESDSDSDYDRLRDVADEAANRAMPLVLVHFASSPGSLRSIQWAIARHDEAEDRVELSGGETIWTPEASAEVANDKFESFDSGTPGEPPVEPLPGSDSGSDE